MKIVSFKVAKVIKDAGFDEICEYAYYKPKDEEPQLIPMEQDWEQTRMNNSNLTDFMECTWQEGDDVTAPTYMEVWLWLWTKKNIRILIKNSEITTQCYATINDIKDTTLFNNPEDAIIAAIDYLVDNDLIK